MSRRRDVIACMLMSPAHSIITAAAAGAWESSGIPDRPPADRPTDSAIISQSPDQTDFRVLQNFAIS